MMRTRLGDAEAAGAYNPLIRDWRLGRHCLQTLSPLPRLRLHTRHLSLSLSLSDGEEMTAVL
jgi:hypothetical protein